MKTKIINNKNYNAEYLFIQNNKVKNAKAEYKRLFGEVVYTVETHNNEKIQSMRKVNNGYEKIFNMEFN